MLEFYSYYWLQTDAIVFIQAPLSLSLYLNRLNFVHPSPLLHHIFFHLSHLTNNSTKFANDGFREWFVFSVHTMSIATQFEWIIKWLHFKMILVLKFVDKFIFLAIIYYCYFICRGGKHSVFTIYQFKYIKLKHSY